MQALSSSAVFAPSLRRSQRRRASSVSAVSLRTGVVCAAGADKPDESGAAPSTQQLGPNAARDAAAERVTYVPKPLPANFGAAFGQDTSPRKPANPFDAKPTAPPKAAGAAAPPASPFGAAAAKPASPFGAAAAKPASPFGSAASSSPAVPLPPQPSAGASPFGASSKPAFPSAGGPAASPFGAAASSTPKASDCAVPAKAAAPKVNQAAQQKKGGFELPKPTLAQVIITVSFTTITTIMFSTVYLVYSAGAIHFNDR